MADTIRTEQELLDSLFQDGQAPNSITAQDLRDLIVSMKTINPELVLDPVHPDHKEGCIFYDLTEHTLAYYNDATDVTVNIAQEMILRVANNSGADIANGEIVYISGAVTGTPTVVKTISSTDTPPIIGMATNNMVNGATGYITVFGIVHGVNTSTYTAGDRIYLSDSVAGGWSAIPPELPNETVRVGVILTAAADGNILIRPTKINNSNQTTAIAEMTHSVTKIIAIAETPEPIPFNTNVVLEQLTHVAGDPDVTIDIDGLYQLQCTIQIASAAKSVVTMWFQKDVGAGWTDIPNTASKQTFGISDSGIFVLSHLSRSVAGDKFRIMWSTDNTGTQITAYTATGLLPAVPSASFFVTKIGTN